MRQKPATMHRRLRHALLAASLLAAGLGASATPGHAQALVQSQNLFAPGPSGAPLWADQAAVAARAAPLLPFFGPQTTPATVPVYESALNPFGASATYQPNGPTVTATNAFFASLGTNGRTCATCHAASAGWSITPVQVQALFLQSLGTNPLFQPVDGANCSTANVSTFFNQLSSSSLLLSKGLIRIFETVSPTAQYSILSVQDPYNCNTSTVPGVGLSAYGPGVAPAGFLSVYRRPLPAVNLAFLSTILADARETTLAQQAIDAARIHSQQTPAQELTLASPQLAQMLAFEENIYAAQTYSFTAGSLTTNGGGGGPISLAALASSFFLGINDPFGGNPSGAAFNPDVYTLYTAWAPGVSGYGAGFGMVGGTQASIARGETIFNTRTFTISGVTGLNDVQGQPSITGTCSTCHDAPNAGSNSASIVNGVQNDLLVDTGVTTPGAPAIDQSGLPVFTLQCNATGQIYTTTDPGRATLSGLCSDISRLKVPTLRNLASRPPYFHNGGAATLGTVVNFYNARFGIGLSSQDQADLVNFLNAL
jgi:cytochrome c peroxidase